MSSPHEYAYHGGAAPWLQREIWPALLRILAASRIGPRRTLDLGCGNGATAHMLAGLGFDVLGVDPSGSGIAAGRAAYPGLRLEQGSTDEDLAARFGRFPLVVSVDVIEHCYAPRRFARALYDLLEDDGLAVVSTPFHGYWKNLALALLGRWDAHLDPLWDHGHIKFFSEATLTRLMREAGFEVRAVHRVGRIPPIAKSMFVLLARPAR